MRRLPVLTLACALLALPAPASARVIAVASGDANLTLADVSTSKVVNRVDVGGTTTGVAMAPDGTRAYVTSGGRIAVVDLDSQKVVAALSGGGTIQGLAV